MEAVGDAGAGDDAMGRDGDPDACRALVGRPGLGRVAGSSDAFLFCADI